MGYLSDRSQPDVTEQLHQQRVRFGVMMLYVLPFALTPLALGSMAIYRSLPRDDVKQLQQQLTVMRSTLPAATEMAQLQSLQMQIQHLDRMIQIKEERRRDFVAARPWAAAFSALGVVLLVVWTVFLIKLMRKRELLEIKWSGVEAG